MNLEQQVIAGSLRTAVLSIDLQIYKGSVYKLRWGSPGGLDHAIPAYREAKRTIDETPWPSDLKAAADDLAGLVESYVETLAKPDVTTASALHSRLVTSFETLRDKVRVWPNGAGSGD